MSIHSKALAHWVIPFAFVLFVMVLVVGANRLRKTDNVYPLGISANCFDSDGGIVPDIWGSVQYRGQKYSDVCLNSTTLKEWYCTNKPQSVSVNCNCFGGACVSGTTTTTTPPCLSAGQYCNSTSQCCSGLSCGTAGFCTIPGTTTTLANSTAH